VFLRRYRGIERAQSHGSQNQLAHERGYINHRAGAFLPGRSQIQHPQRDFAVHLNAASEVGGDPDRAVRRNYPAGLVGMDGHHAAGSVDQLIPARGGRRCDFLKASGAKCHAEGSRQNRAIGVVAGIRHQLAEYRNSGNRVQPIESAMTWDGDMGKPAHFAINAADLTKARQFYEAVFGWKFQAWGPPGFYMIDMGTGVTPPLRGSLQQRREIVPGVPMRSFECTISVDDIQATGKAIEANGGKIAMPICELTGIGQLLFFEDPDGNIAGAMQYEAA
jgi:predicted enzyme related to lactoylglutathione lyase